MRRPGLTVWVALEPAWRHASAAAKTTAPSGDGQLSLAWIAVVALLVLLAAVLLTHRPRLALLGTLAEHTRSQLQGALERQASELRRFDARLKHARALQAEWAGIVDRDLIGALASIAEAAPLLRNADLPSHLHQQAVRIHAAAQSAKRSLGVLSDAAQLETGTLALVPARFDFDSLLQDFSEAVAPRVLEQGRELIIEVEPDVPESALGDATRLLDLLLARMETVLGHDGGDVLLHVGLDQPRVGLPSPAAGEALLLRFERSGGSGGSPEEDGSSAARRLADAVHARLIELMQGESGVREVLGKGRVAWFTAQLQAGDDVGAEGLALGGRRILIVDDNERARTMLASMLAHWGANVMSVATGYAAIQAASAAGFAGPGFDLVMVDTEMPELGGLETIRLLRTSGLRKLPALVLLSKGRAADPVLLAQAQDEGVAEVLDKPLGRRAVRRALQLVLDEADAKPAGTQREAGMPAALLALGGARVLLVEDNEINQQIALELLQASGMEVQVAAHGQAALDLLNWQFFDLVLMDLQMPVLDGLAATRLIRAEQRHAALPIIAMTAAGSQLERQRCLDAGMNAHLLKPFDLPSLWAVLQRWIVPRPALGAAPAGGTAETREPGAQPHLRLPASMPGFDVTRALGRMGGRVDLYLRTARMFVDTQAGVVQELQDALDAGDRETAIRLATTLKNLAGNLGAEALQNEALGLEAYLREGADGLARNKAVRVQEALEVVCFVMQPIRMPPRQAT